MRWQLRLQPCHCIRRHWPGSTFVVEVAISSRPLLFWLGLSWKGWREMARKRMADTLCMYKIIRYNYVYLHRWHFLTWNIMLRPCCIFKSPARFIDKYLVRYTTTITGDRFEIVYQSILTQHGSTNSHSRGPLTKMMPVWAWLRNFGAFLGPPNGGAISPYLAYLVLGGPKIIEPCSLQPLLLSITSCSCWAFCWSQNLAPLCNTSFNESCRKTWPQTRIPKPIFQNPRKSPHGRTFRELPRTSKVIPLDIKTPSIFNLEVLEFFFLNQIWIPTIESDTWYP